MSREGELRSLAGRLKEAIRDLNEPPERYGADVEAVLERIAGETEYTESDARDVLTRLLKRGGVYPPAEGRVRVTP